MQDRNFLAEFELTYSIAQTQTIRQNSSSSSSSRKTDDSNRLIDTSNDDDNKATDMGGGMERVGNGDEGVEGLRIAVCDDKT